MKTPASPTRRTEPTFTRTGGESGCTAVGAGAAVAPGATAAAAAVGPAALLAAGFAVAGAPGGVLDGPLQATVASAARSTRCATGAARRSVVRIVCSPAV